MKLQRVAVPPKRATTTSSRTDTATKPKVALGMSGGVDSSLCAHLLVEQGYDVTGVYLECWRAPGCRTDADRKDALTVALSLGIPFKVLDFKETYREKVVEDFFAEYEAGRTPNPDVLCNKEIKFGLFYDWAMEKGFEYIATGHYAQIAELPDGTATLTIPADTHKDQTYFLYLLKQEQLAHIIFPLAQMTKQEVREEAKRRSLPVADKKDSVGICFIGNINVHEFLRERLGENPGEVVDTAGRVIGTHQGLWFYTIGQRHGFTLQPKTLIHQPDGSTLDRQNIPPFYVIAKNPAKNQLVVGFGAETLRDAFRVERPHWTAGSFAATMRMLSPGETSSTPLHCLVRIRHTGALLDCTITIQNNPQEIYSLDTGADAQSHAQLGSQLTVQLDEPTKGLAEGQSAVFYYCGASERHTTLLLGGGLLSLPQSHH
jgi:tRNA-specific 2-thiouridylase